MLLSPSAVDIALAALRRQAAQVDADEFAAGILKGHRQQVAADAAASSSTRQRSTGAGMHAVELRNASQDGSGWVCP